MRLRNIPGADECIVNHRLAVEEEESSKQKGKWSTTFGNDKPIHIEVGMGKGQFILSLAKKNPEINYVGIERYSSVLVRALEKHDTEEFEEVENIRFICMDANNIEEVFDYHEVSKIYLNFSDPWPKARHAKRRLTSQEFLKRYDIILKQEGFVEFKTDNRKLFDFSLEEVGESKWELVAHSFDLHKDEVLNEGNIMTEYEEKFSSMGDPIHKMIISRI